MKHTEPPPRLRQEAAFYPIWYLFERMRNILFIFWDWIKVVVLGESEGGVGGGGAVFWMLFQENTESFWPDKILNVNVHVGRLKMLP